MSSSKSNQDLSDLWTQHQRKNTKIPLNWACIFCPNQRIFATEPALWEHATAEHGEQLSTRNGDLQDIREQYAAESAQKKPEKDSSQQRTTNLNEANRAQLEALTDRGKTARSSQPQTRQRQLWQGGQAPLTKSSFDDPSNIASIAVQKARAQQHYPSKPRLPSQNPPPAHHSPRPATTQPSGKEPDNYDILPQPETRPISQEQLVAEVKGIYAGLVMVEAKCIEVDNKQAALAQADSSAQPKLNNEQWQALIALHRTLLHEHHDFFLASQHPSASAALRRLASKYAMPARMWRHGIHSFLELLRHRMPASLDHMLAFIYLAYSMMALLYETVPAFEDTWIECLGDLGRYRMAIEDGDIRDREVWTGVARHWYSKASDKALTTGRLYHHLAILARPNTLQQLFYYAKSLCVVIPFTSARESILTLFDPVLNAENPQGQYRLPPLDTSFIKAHGLLFTNKNMDRFDSTKSEFLNLLDNQIGRVTRKFMEQGYHIALANCVAMLGFVSKDNALMKAMVGVDADEEFPIAMVPATADLHSSMCSFRSALELSNHTLEIVLQRIGDPNVLPFLHVTLVFMYHIARHPGAMQPLQANFPWECLSTMLNTLHASYETANRVEQTSFPQPEKDDVRPFPEDFALRGLSWTEGYFPEDWFSNGNIQTEQSPQVLHTKPCHDKAQNQTLPHQDSGSRLNSAEELSIRHHKLGKLSSILHRLPMRRSGSLTSVFRLLQRFKRVLGASVILGQLGLVEASCTEKTQSATTNLWRPTALATTIVVCCLSMRAAKKKWNLDLLLAANIVTPLACMYVAVDNEFSDHELFILWLYGAGLDFMWLKDKILKYPRSAGVVSLLLPTVGVLSASQFVHKFPALQSRFNDQVLPIAILSFPTTVFCSLMWVAIGRTGFAEDLENGEYNPHIFGFIKYVFDTLVLSMIQQLIRNFTAYFLGQNVPNIGNETLRRQQHDIEADRPGDEVFRGRSPYRPARGERSSSEWSPDHY